ncbi:MAG: hypothetical protein IPJ86_06000 [Bacteroidetes bacterium]|nr:hypothetical protein [Bacteroidota bacterium]
MEEFKSNFIDLFGVIEERILFKAAVAHHRPEKDFLQEIIQKADHLASGMDRTKDSGMKDGQDEQQWDAFKKKRLIPLLGIIGKDAVDCKERWPVVALDLNRNNFPREDAESNEEGYDQLWSKFCEEFREVSSKDFEVFSFTLNTLLLKYTTCIPSSTINLPDVSLYDHLQSTAAFAVCLYDYLKEKGLQVRELKEEDEAFLLIGGIFQEYNHLFMISLAKVQPRTLRVVLLFTIVSRYYYSGIIDRIEFTPILCYLCFRWRFLY